MNPILQALNKNSMLKQNDLLGMVSALKNGDPEVMARQMMSSNPQFRRFVEANQGKSPEQVARENGIDFDSVRNLLR